MGPEDPIREKATSIADGAGGGSMQPTPRVLQNVGFLRGENDFFEGENRPFSLPSFPIPNQSSTEKSEEDN